MAIYVDWDRVYGELQHDYINHDSEIYHLMKSIEGRGESVMKSITAVCQVKSIEVNKYTKKNPYRYALEPINDDAPYLIYASFNTNDNSFRIGAQMQVTIEVMDEPEVSQATDNRSEVG